MTPKISVLMSTHCRNRTNPHGIHLLRRAIEGILKQTYTDFEFLIVDDASTDGTSEVLKEYSAKDSRIKITRFEESCKGFTSKRYNWLTKQAANDIILNAFDDEQMYPHALATLIKPFEEDPTLDMVYAIGEPIAASTNKPMGLHGSPWSDQIYRSNIVPCGATLINRKVFEAIGYGDESEIFRRISDYEFWMRLRYNNRKVRHIPIVVGQGYVGEIDSLGMTVPIDHKEVEKQLKIKFPGAFK